MVMTRTRLATAAVAIVVCAAGWADAQGAATATAPTAVAPTASSSSLLPDLCAFCGAWSLAHDATIALQDVPLDHAQLVYDAMHSMHFEMAFSPEGTACMSISRRGEHAVASIGWSLVEATAGSWRVRNTPESGRSKEMVLSLDSEGHLVLRQPARMDEPLVFTRVARSADAADWCVQQGQEVAQ